MVDGIKAMLFYHTIGLCFILIYLYIGFCRLECLSLMLGLVCLNIFNTFSQNIADWRSLFVTLIGDHIFSDYCMEAICGADILVLTSSRFVSDGVLAEV